MHDEPNDKGDAGDAPILGPAALQRAVLSALVSDPADDGIDVAALASALGRAMDDVDRAISRLEAVGLVHRSGSAARASGAAMHVDELWRVFR